MNKKTEQKLNFFFNRYFKWFVLLIVLAFLVAGYFVVIKPKYQQTIQSIQRHVKLQSQNYLVKKENLEKAKELISVYNNTDNEKIRKINTLLPTDPSHEELFTVFDDLTSRNGLVLNRMDIFLASEKEEESRSRIGKKKEGAQLMERNLPEYIKKAEISIEVLGTDYAGLKSFLTSLENNLRLVDVVNINFDPGRESAELQLWTYFFSSENFDIKRDVEL